MSTFTLYHDEQPNFERFFFISGYTQVVSGHFATISCCINTYFITCQNFMIRRELCRVATSNIWPSDEDLAYTMTSAISKCTGKKLSEPN